MENTTISNQVISGIKRRGSNKAWVAEKLGITRPTLYARLKDGKWEPEQITILKQIGIII